VHGVLVDRSLLSSFCFLSGYFYYFGYRQGLLGLDYFTGCELDTSWFRLFLFLRDSSSFAFPLMDPKDLSLMIPSGWPLEFLRRTLSLEIGRYQFRHRVELGRSSWQSEALCSYSSW
jgi:hypothetical protein